MKIPMFGNAGFTIFHIACVVTALVLSGRIFGATTEPKGYEALGHLTYTRFGQPGVATFKTMLLFRFRTFGDAWHVRIEPVIEVKGGIGFYESSNTKGSSITAITALAAAYNIADSPFTDLRLKLKASNHPTLTFSNAAPAFTLNRLSNPPGTGSPLQPSANHIHNEAIATIVNGEIPRIDASYQALVWFAFTPQKRPSGGLEKFLPQIWDDGNRATLRFRKAQSSRFDAPPNIVSDAVYFWSGRESKPNGKTAEISVADIQELSLPAARYEVTSSTNLNRLVLPTTLKLTRYDTHARANSFPEVVTTVDLLVDSIRIIDSEAVREVQLPAKTYITDYRPSPGAGLEDLPLRYMSASKAPAATHRKESKVSRVSPETVHSDAHRLQASTRKPRGAESEVEAPIPPFTATLSARTSEFVPGNSQPSAISEANVTFSYNAGWWRVDALTVPSGSERQFIESCMTIPNGVRYIRYPSGAVSTNGKPLTATALSCPMSFPAPGASSLFVPWLALCPKPALPIIDELHIRRLINVPECELGIWQDVRNKGTYSVTYQSGAELFISDLKIRNDGTDVNLRTDGSDLVADFVPFPPPFNDGFEEFTYQLLETTNFQGIVFPSKAVAKRHYPIFDSKNSSALMTRISTEITVLSLSPFQETNTQLRAPPQRLVVTDHRPTNLPINGALFYTITNDVWTPSRSR